MARRALTPSPNTPEPSSVSSAYTTNDEHRTHQGLIRRFKHVVDERIENPQAYDPAKYFQVRVLACLCGRVCLCLFCMYGDACVCKDLCPGA